ncbi:MAG: ABC transporter substrate-binding protein [Deltaproteobacteria bacterium]|nr:ABC transporter substrate-binding protein [Deltaproteobacteria bacterium]
MSCNKRCSYMMALIAVICFFFHIPMIEAASYKILVVMSYEEENPWCIQIKEGIDSVFAGNSDIKYFYMDTKKNINGGVRKAEEAHELYKQFRPDGVIAADDNAQSMFVLPYLKDKVKTPVMFCAVNAEPEKYGYPASNVSGILERDFVRESIAFAKQLVPSIKTVGFLAKDSPSGRAIRKQVEMESDTYLTKFAGFKLVQTIKETIVAIEAYQKTSDALFITSTNGILDADGNSLDNKQVTKIVAKFYKKPLIGANDFHVKYGVLCAVIKSGNAQGKISAEMLLKAMKGTPVKDIPVTVNKYGRRILNISTMKDLGIRPKRRVLVGTQLVKTSGNIK